MEGRKKEYGGGWTEGREWYNRKKEAALVLAPLASIESTLFPAPAALPERYGSFLPQKAIIIND